jgi:hypothetical protein
MTEQLLTELTSAARSLPETELRLLLQLAKKLPTTGVKPVTPPTPSPARSGKPPIEVATDEELNGRWGNPAVFKDPPRWEGQPYEGVQFSACPPEYLENLASFLEWRAQKEDEQDKRDKQGRPRSSWSRKEAKLARGWADRLRRNAVKPAPQSESFGGFHEDDIPF